MSLETLDDLHESLNRRYFGQNFYRSADSLFAHLVEAITPIGSALAGREKSEGTERLNLAKTLAWWMTLCGKIGVLSVSGLVWAKYPDRCPNCLKSQHDDSTCKKPPPGGGAVPGINWKQLMKHVEDDKEDCPKTIVGWKKMLADIYPTNRTRGSAWVYNRLIEEVGELGESVRLLPANTSNFLQEATDVFAWIIAFDNALDEESVWKEGESLEHVLMGKYGKVCPSCDKEKCECNKFLMEYSSKMSAALPPEVMNVLARQGWVVAPADAAFKFAGVAEESREDFLPSGGPIQRGFPGIT